MLNNKNLNQISFKQLQVICVHRLINCNYPLRDQVLHYNGNPCNKKCCPVWARWIKHNEQNRKGNIRRSKLRRTDKLKEAQLKRFKEEKQKGN